MAGVRNKRISIIALDRFFFSLLQMEVCYRQNACSVLFICVLCVCVVSSHTAWLTFDTSSALNTCATKLAALNFIIWLYSSNTATTLAQAYNIQMLPEIYVEATKLTTKLKQAAKCDGE